MPFDPRLLEALLAESADTRSIDLDELAERIAPYDLDAAEIDELVSALEREGRTVGVAATYRLREELARVLPAARAFAAKNGRRPSVQELAEEAGVDVRTVRRALMFGQVMGR